MSSIDSSTDESPWLARLRRTLESNAFQRFIIAVIVINAITLGLETSPSIMSSFGTLLMALDHLALAIFVLEIAAKLIVYRLAFFKDPWNIFDFTIVAIAVMPTTGGLSVLRALRILRAMRLISVVPEMRRVVHALLHAIPAMGSVVALLALIFYVCAVMTTKLFGERFDEFFGSIGKSLYSLFQIMTLESWSMGIVRPVMEVYPYAWAFFVPFILTVTFAVLNLFIAIVVNSMQEAASADTELLHEDAEKLHADAQLQARQHEVLMQEIRSLREEIAALRGMVKVGP